MSDEWLPPLHELAIRWEGLDPFWRVREDWPRNRANFCRGLDPERFLADIHGYGWTPEMITELEAEVRRRMREEPEVPVIEHMLDAAIAVRHGQDIRHQECRIGYGVSSPRISEITDADQGEGARRGVSGDGLDD